MSSEKAFLLPNWFTFEEQADGHPYRQLGNGISIGAAYQAIRALINRDEEILLETIPEMVESVKKAPKNADGVLNSLRTGLL